MIVVDIIVVDVVVAVAVVAVVDVGVVVAVLVACRWLDVGCCVVVSVVVVIAG